MSRTQRLTSSATTRKQAHTSLGRHLISLGHQAIAIIAGPQEVSTSEDRVAGFQRALTEAGLEKSAPVYHGKIATVYYGALTQKSGYDMTQEALKAEPRPTAMFAANNFLALGALHALHDAGVRVPEDMAVVTFDDLLPSFVPVPFLTVADQPAYEMGQKAVEMLLSRLSDKQEPFQEVLLESKIIIRQSSGGKREPTKSL